MNDQLTETEIKFYTPDFSEIKNKLDTLGATYTKPRVYERNVRYENADKTLTEQGIVVRLRQDHAIKLTYKEPPSTLPDNPNISHRFEAEVEVNDYNTMDVILNKLGYTPHIIYEKYRTTYQLNDVEIVLDEMPYGNFIEIEGAEPAIETTIIQFGIENETRILQNYLQLFDAVKSNLQLDFHDLTFANFEGIDVPLSAFGI